MLDYIAAYVWALVAVVSLLTAVIIFMKSNSVKTVKGVSAGNRGKRAVIGREFGMIGQVYPGTNDNSEGLQRRCTTAKLAALDSGCFGETDKLPAVGITEELSQFFFQKEVDVLVTHSDGILE